MDWISFNFLLLLSYQPSKNNFTSYKFKYTQSIFVFAEPALQRVVKEKRSLFFRIGELLHLDLILIMAHSGCSKATTSCRILIDFVCNGLVGGPFFAKNSGSIFF